MKLPTRRRDSGVRFNITPLIDICFNLIVFFALASLSARKENAEQIALPRAKGAEAADAAAPRRLVITVDAARRVLIAGEEIDRADLERRIAERSAPNAAGLEVRIRADRSVPFGDIKPMILACSRQGVTNLKFAAQTP